MMRFLRDVRPSRILSFHQPLRGVDTDTKMPRFARRVARKLDLPVKTFDCGGVCHGTMTMWYNHRLPGRRRHRGVRRPPSAVPDAGASAPDPLDLGRPARVATLIPRGRQRARGTRRQEVGPGEFMKIATSRAQT